MPEVQLSAIDGLRNLANVWESPSEGADMPALRQAVFDIREQIIDG